MVDTTDSKSVASNRVRVQVSSPVSGNFLCLGSSFFLTDISVYEGLELISTIGHWPVCRSGTALALCRFDGGT